MLAFAPLDTAVAAVAPAGAALTALLTPLAGPAAGAAAIVSLTIVLRLLVAPLSYLRFRAVRRRARLAPQIAELQRRHAGDPARLAAELSALGAGPLAGCLPVLIQAPVFFVAYRLCSTATVDGQPNPLLGGHLFGLPLGDGLGASLTGGAGAAALPVFAVLLLVATLLAWWSSRRLRATLPAPGPAGPPAPGPGGPAGGAAGGGAGSGAPLPDEVTAVLRRVLPLLPYAALLALPVVPLAAALHLVTTTAVTVLEQLLMHPLPPT